MPGKRKSRDQKKAERQKRAADHEIRRWQPFATLLAALPIPSRFKKLAEANKSWFFKHVVPSPRVVLEESAAGSPDAEHLRDEADQVFQDVTLDLPVHVSALQFLTAGTTLPSFYNALQFTGPSKSDEEQFLVMRQSVHQFIREHLDAVLAKLVPELELVSIKYSRIDRSVYWLVAGFVEVEGVKNVFRVCVHRTDSQMLMITVDGKARPAYRCGGGFIQDGIRWITWPASCIGNAGPQAVSDYKVYVQSHAIEQLHSRMPFTDASAIHDGMVLSLSKPVLVNTSEDNLLIEYRFFKYKFGYFVAQRVTNIVLVRTFLFLTMQGTPEAAKLRQNLRLQRPDIEYLGLDKPASFLLSDLATDPGLAQLFEECGCGHLLRFARPEFREKFPGGMAQRVREYLNIPLDSSK